jgi:alpha-galactosidase
MKRFFLSSLFVLGLTGRMISAETEGAGWIPAQTFTMGDTDGTGWPDQRPAHTVTLSRFYIAPELVTVQEYCDFLNTSDWIAEDGTFIVRKGSGDVLVNFPFSPITKSGSRFAPKPGTARQPMYYVTWEGSALYCNYLSLKEGRKPAYQPDNLWACDFASGGYHLPTEAQWECAARGGKGNYYPCGKSISPSMANYNNSLGGITNVGSYPANAYGLRDMAGNVMQWCNDFYKFDYYSDCGSGSVNPTGPAIDELTGHGVRLLRGGAFYQPATFQTCSYRYGTADTKGCFSYNGFRVARSGPSQVALTHLNQRTGGSETEMAATTNWLETNFLKPARHYGGGQTFPFSFKLGGKPSGEFMKSWRMSVTEQPLEGGKMQRVIHAQDPKTGLQISCVAITYAGLPVIDWTLQITNSGNSDSPIIEDLQGMDHSFVRPAGEKREFVLRHSKGSRAAAVDFWPTDDVLGPGATFTMGGHGGRPSDYSFPFMNLSWGSGGAIMAIGWSGQWMSRFERDDKDSLRVRTGLEYFHAKLHPGEGIRSPRILLTFWDGEDPLRGHNLFRQFMLSYGIPKIDGEHLIPPIAASFAGLNDYTESNQLAVAPKYGERGIEAQWIDAGWFVGGWPNGAGTWEPKPESFPRGLGPVGDAIHAAGMKFVLWFEIERVSHGSQIEREHPEWVIGPITEYGGVFNWGIPAARQWMTEKVSEQIRLGHVDIFREDFNMEPLMYWQRDDAPDRLGMTEMRFVEGMYQIWDDLRARHPGLWIDNCASGGRMFDLETATRSISLTQSDGPYEGDRTVSTAVINQLQNDGLNLYLPMHAGANFGIEPSYDFRSGMTSGNVLAWPVDKEPVEKMRPTINIYKKVRPYFEGDYYPLFDHRLEETVWFGYQLDRPDLQRGMVVLLRRSAALTSKMPVSLHGIDYDAQYKVRDEDTGETKVMSGNLLRTMVVDIAKSSGSKILFYEKQ